MRWVSSFFGMLATLAVVAIALHLLGLDDFLRDAITSGHLLDWVMGALCFLWLLVILKAPWDLFFEAHRVAFEQQRSRERNIALVPGRETYIQTVRLRLGLLAVGSHLFSAALVAGVSYFTGGMVGYYFAVFYLVSTFFRPMVAGYVYLSGKLRAMGEESRYPREDVELLRFRVTDQEAALKQLSDDFAAYQTRTEAERMAQEAEVGDLRQRLHALGREFETTVSRLTDNQEVIKGIQAFVRLIAQSTRPV